MRVAIVGHGPSMKGAGLGPEIEAHDRIVRLKQGWMMPQVRPDDYGSRLDIICSTLKTWRPYWKLPIKEYWGYQSFPGQDASLGKIREHFGSIPVHLAGAAISRWLGEYRELADIRGGWERPSDGMTKVGDEPWFSTGMGAIVMACALLLPETVTLFGFDNLVQGRREEFTNIFRTTDHEYPRHAWNIEWRMLQLLEKEYNVRIDSKPIPRTSTCDGAGTSVGYAAAG